MMNETQQSVWDKIMKFRLTTVFLLVGIPMSCKTPAVPVTTQEVISETNPAGESTVRSPGVNLAPSPAPSPTPTP